MDIPVMLILVIVGLFAYAGYKTWKLIDLSRRTSAGKSWPAIPGEVLSKYIDESTDNESGTSYYPTVRYKYAVMGREYEKEITLHGIFNRSRSEKALSKIADTIEVRYNPEKPEENITGQEKIALGDILTIAGVIVVAVLIVIGSLT
ncbi:MAG: DUF3592 domain-containing protein [Anaerolineaceae bacterium]